MTCIHRLSERVAIAVLAIACQLTPAAEPQFTVERIQVAPPKTVTTVVRESLAGDAIAVSEAKTPYCTIWLRKDIPTTEGRVASGTLVGAIQFQRDWSDFKTQEAPNGPYTLRYVLQPKTKDHEGTAPHRDFVILVPAAEDTKLDVLPVKNIVQKSGKATGGTHPVVMLLYPIAKPPTKPTIEAKGKHFTLAVRWNKDSGYAFTLVGSSVD